MNRTSLAQQAETSSFLPPAQGILQRKCSCGNQTIAGGECTECTKKQNSLQSKLAIGASNDPLEREADRVADQVLAMPTNSNIGRTPPRIQRLTGQPAGKADTAPASVDRVLSSSGRSLQPALRQDMEQRFRHDFSQVRVHSGAAAEQSARDVSAHAYTAGHHVVFGAGQFAPGASAGRRLLAHELTHVVQQSGNVSDKIHRQPDDDKKKPSSKIGRELNKNEIFQKLPKFARDKILEEIDKAPETITKVVLDKIIDLAPIDSKLKEGLKKAGEAIIATIKGRKPASFSKCDIPGFHEGTSSTYKGMCCRGTTESEIACCPKDKFAPNNLFSHCCKANEFVNAEGKCAKHPPFDPSSICIFPGKKDALGQCCRPPKDVIGGTCVLPPKPKPKQPAQPLSLKFTIGVIDDYNIDESIINSRQKSHFDEVKNQIIQFMETCPASMITIVGFTDKPGTEKHNLDLGQRRADYAKLLIQLDLMKVDFGAFSPLIFTSSDGENSPVDMAAGENFSAQNRRIQIKFNSLCPPLSSPSFINPLADAPLRMGLPQKYDITK